jgi:thiamine biosynthesis protein ThiS
VAEISILLNGETRTVPEAIKLDDLLERFSLPKQRIAVELNKMVVRRTDWPSTSVNDGDRLEVVHFVGGG